MYLTCVYAPFHVIHGWPYSAVGRPGRAICNIPGVGSYVIAPPKSRQPCCVPSNVGTIR